ncbi:MAG: diguanylate cyclase [Planctomycetota bacterium]|nr:MAG: diguanylate cyclase [Planctomycetota bacterium]
MLAYILRRLMWMVPTMFGITFLLLMVIQLAPGDPAALAVGGESSGGMVSTGTGDTNSAYDKFRERFKLDEPLWTQYATWVGNVVQLDFGTEFFRSHVQVRDELWRRLQVTIPLALISTLLSYLIAIPLGIYSAIKRGSTGDKVITFGLFLLYSLPTFWAGLMLILAFGATGVDWFPVIGLHDKDADLLSGWAWWKDMLWHAVLPIATYTYGGLAYLSRQMRVGMLETIQQDYIRTARAKGLTRRNIILRHALRNSVIPVITVFATILPILVGGSVLVETIFNIQGMGLYAFEGLIKRDYNVIMATVTASAFMTLVGFLVSDILYAVVDPRIKYD